MTIKMLGKIGAWLCDHCDSRPATKAEAAQVRQYASLMSAVLGGNVSYYGRDRECDAIPLVSERRDYDALYAKGQDKLADGLGAATLKAGEVERG